MEEKSEKSLAFSVRVFSLQEEVRAEEEHMETPEEKEAQVQEEVSRRQQVSVCRQGAEQELTLLLSRGPEDQQLTVQDANRVLVFQFSVSEEMDCCQVGGQSFLVTIGKQSLLLQFKTPTDMKNFQRSLKRGDDNETRKGDATGNKDAAKGQTRPPMPEDGPTQSYQFHSCLSQHQSLLQDYLRIATYQRAILLNERDFRDKVVLDVCCGSGILSFFAVQAGATRVYAVESNPMAKYTQKMLFDRIFHADLGEKRYVCVGLVRA